MKQWTRTELGYLAYFRCTTCGGTGVRREIREDPVPCRCALRAMFRACYERFRVCHSRGKHKTPAAFDRAAAGKTNRGMWGRKEEEFIADFEVVSRRALDPWHYRLFRWYFLLGADWRMCSTRLGVDRGKVYHAVYRIEERLGYTFAALEPYPLYPPREYFSLHALEPVEASSAAAVREARKLDPVRALPVHRVPALRSA